MALMPPLEPSIPQKVLGEIRLFIHVWNVVPASMRTSTTYSANPEIDVRKSAADHDFEIPERPEYEEFYALCALELGDPTQAPAVWEKFHRMRAEYFEVPYTPYSEKNAEAVEILAYMLWYQREKDRMRDKGISQ